MLSCSNNASEVDSHENTITPSNVVEEGSTPNDFSTASCTQLKYKKNSTSAVRKK